jgi:glycosyltransferase involved in cell wall biosynthesis
MADALLRLLDDPTLAAKMGAAGRERAGEFGARKMVDDIAALYEALLAERVPEQSAGW